MYADGVIIVSGRKPCPDEPYKLVEADFQPDCLVKLARQAIENEQITMLMASPFIATIVDALSLLIYLRIATLILRLCSKEKDP